MKDILTRYREHLYRFETPPSERVKQFLADLNESGRWADVDYEDEKRGAWDLMIPASRLRDFAMARVAPDLAEDLADGVSGEELDRAIHRVLDDWLANRYKSSNWWYNQIGIPRLMRDTAVLLEGRLDAPRWEGLLEIVNQHKVEGTGANLLWTAETALHYACLVQDGDLLADAAQRIRGEIVVGQREGIQTDWSFFQHGERPQTFHYGSSYMHVALTVGRQLQGTPWEYSEEEVAILSNFLLEGAQWMLRGEYTVPSTLDRSASRPGSMRVNLEPFVSMWSKVDSTRRGELRTFAARMTGGAEPLNGFRHFDRADFTLYHRPGFSYFVKMISDRTFLTETLNQENHFGNPVFHTGDHYLVRNGQEYVDLMPVWDWERLPGIASASGMREVERKPFVGGLGDGTSGVSAMDQVRTGEEGAELALRRSWFFHRDMVISLAGGWELSGDTSDPWLVLDQSRLRDAVSVVDTEGHAHEIEAGEHWKGSAVAVSHGDVAWIPLGRAPVSVQIVKACGSWRRINSNYSEEPIEEKVFLASMEFEGASPEAGGFAVLPGVDPAEAVRIAGAPPWTVLRNDRAVQALEFADDGVGMAVFYETGAVEFGGRELSVSRPCLVFRRGETLSVADPLGGEEPVEVLWVDERRLGGLC